MNPLLRAWLAVWHAPGRAVRNIWSGLLSADIARLSILLAAGGGVAWTLIAAGYVLKIHERLTSDHLFWIVIGAHALVFTALLVIGRREFSASLGRGGLNLNVGGEDEPAAKITTTTEVEVGAGELPPDQRVQR